MAYGAETDAIRLVPGYIPDLAEARISVYTMSGSLAYSAKTGKDASAVSMHGYTGHEMMPDFGLVNMGGRLYDPRIGRFLSPDRYVQMPDNSQNFNRYSYCLNNPLKYTDPSGNAYLVDDIAVFFGRRYRQSCRWTGLWRS